MLDGMNGISIFPYIETVLQALVVIPVEFHYHRGICESGDYKSQEK